MHSVKEVGHNKTALVRVDFNVPLKNNRVSNDKRIRVALPTIKLLLKKKAGVILISHLGRPKGKIAKKLRLKPVANKLSKLLKKKVKYIDSLNCPDVKSGEVILLENLRFYPGEKKDSETFAKKLASFADVYVNDAFAVNHRAHASLHAITKYLPSYAGLHLQKEIKALSHLLKKPKRPFIAVIGGAKISTKIDVIKNLLKKVDAVLIGSALALTFYKALGYEIGKSLYDPKKVSIAKTLLKKSKNKIMLPIDFVVASSIRGKPKNVAARNISKGMMALDIGPETQLIYSEIIKKSNTVCWNGPMGVYEVNKFAKGTSTVAKAIAQCKGVTTVGGGDVLVIVDKLKLAKKFSHVSTGGGAMLKFLEGKKLPGIKALK